VSTITAHTAQDPMLIRWSDQENYQRLDAGNYQSGWQFPLVFWLRRSLLRSRLVRRYWYSQIAAVFSMQYLGPPYVWGFNILSDNISIAGPNAVGYGQQHHVLDGCG
jgi:hypothetical protein